MSAGGEREGPNRRSAAWTEWPVSRLGAGRERGDADRLAVEAPLELRVGGEPFTVLMRTPGDDEELATGFFVSEGIVAGPSGIRKMSRPVAIRPTSRPSASTNASRASWPASFRSRASAATATIRDPAGACHEIRP